MIQVDSGYVKVFTSILKIFLNCVAPAESDELIHFKVANNRNHPRNDEIGSVQNSFASQDL